MKVSLITLFVILGLNNLSFAQSTDFFQKSNSFLNKNVIEGRVAYSNIKQNKKELLEIVDLIQTEKWVEKEEKAYLINAYNILVIHKIIEKYPMKSPLDENDFFDKNDIILNGKKTSLNKIENDLLRSKYKDERIHFALVCGAIGCPPIRSEAYFPDKLEEQLNEQTSQAINNKKFVWQDEAKNIYISEIFEWYKEDFGGTDQGIFDFINRYKKKTLRDDFTLITYNYDWTINDLNTAESVNNHNNVKEELSLDEDINLQNFTSGSLLGKGSIDFTLFNTIYTENKNNWIGQNYSGYRSTFVTHLFQFTYGLTKSQRINIGVDLHLKNSGNSVDSSFSGLRTAFNYSNTDSTRFGLTSIGVRLKFQPFKGANNFTIQTSLSAPTIPNPEGIYISENNSKNRYWADWDRITWLNQFFLVKDWSKIQLFTEIDMIFRFKKYKSQIGMVDFPMNIFLSYFPNSKFTIYLMSQHVPRFTNNINSQDPIVTDWVIPMNYTASGIGFKYNITKAINLELLYTNFWRGKNTGLGSTYNFGIKYIIN